MYNFYFMQWYFRYNSLITKAPLCCHPIRGVCYLETWRFGWDWQKRTRRNKSLCFECYVQSAIRITHKPAPIFNFSLRNRYRIFIATVTGLAAAEGNAISNVRQIDRNPAGAKGFPSRLIVEKEQIWLPEGPRVHDRKVFPKTKPRPKQKMAPLIRTIFKAAEKCWKKFIAATFALIGRKDRGSE